MTIFPLPCFLFFTTCSEFIYGRRYSETEAAAMHGESVQTDRRVALALRQ